MAGEHWATLPLSQLIADEPAGPGRIRRRCKLCKARVPPSTEDTANEQILIHLQRDHMALFDEGGQVDLPVKMKRRLAAEGWTPPDRGQVPAVVDERRADGPPVGP